MSHTALLRLLLIVTSVIVAAVRADAAFQSQPFTPEKTEVSFVTVFPGSEIYELEGHSAIRIRFPDGRDVAFNFGLFDFAKPNFVYHFVKGETDYMVGAIPWNYFVESYSGSGRRIEEQPLALSPVQTSRLLELLEIQLRPENRTYRYNYVKDNCATRPLRIVELALGDSIILAPSSAERELPALTFRNVMRRYHSNYPWYQFGIDLALGSGIDYTLDRRELSFAPVVLVEQLDGATAGGLPVVTGRRIITEGTGPTAAADPTPWYLTPMSVFSILLAIAIILSIRDIRRGRVSRWFDTALFGILGLTGCLLTFLIFVSSHEATSPNWLYAWLNPLCLIPAVFLWLKNGRRIVIWYQIINFAVLIVLTCTWPLLPQSANPAFLPIVACECVRAASYIFINRKYIIHER